MKFYQLSVLIAATALLLFSNCKKKDTTTTTTCTAGSGGTIAIVAYAVHNGDTLINYGSHPDTAFVKYNTTTSPGTLPSNFDTYFVSDAGEDHVHCESLKCGDYYIYRTAFDSVANKVYRGGTSVNLAAGAIEKDVFITVN